MIADCQRVAADAATLLTSRPPLLGGGRLVCVDGRSGSGKTTLAAKLACTLRERRLIVRELAIESAYAGWDGLLGTPAHVAGSLLAPLTSGHDGTVRTYDWRAAHFIADRPIEPLVDDEILVIEGVGSGTAPMRAYASLVVWCEASDAVRRRRATSRDGDGGWWQGWAAQEDALFGDDPVCERADLVWRSDTETA